MEIVNTFQAKVVQSVKGLDEPQGVLYAVTRRMTHPAVSRVRILIFSQLFPLVAVRCC
jgi:hypothetical protein